MKWIVSKFDKESNFSKKSNTDKGRTDNSLPNYSIDKIFLVSLVFIYASLFTALAVGREEISEFIKDYHIIEGYTTAIIFYVSWKLLESAEVRRNINSNITQLHEKFEKISGENAISRAFLNKMAVQQQVKDDISSIGPVLDVLNIKFEKQIDSIVYFGHLEVVGYHDAIGHSLNMASDEHEQLTIKSHIDPVEWRDSRMSAALDIYLGELRECLGANNARLVRIVIIEEKKAKEWGDKEWDSVFDYENKIREIPGSVLFLTDNFDKTNGSIRNSH